MKNKKAFGPILAIIFVSVIIAVGYFIGRHIASEYNKKHQTNKNVFEILKEITIEKPLNYILVDNESTLSSLCGKDTGICDSEAGIITLDNTEVKLHLYANFDNPEDLPTTYFKLNNIKIGSFVYLDKFAVFNKEFLMITEPNSYNDNYIIHLYNKTGKEVASYEATKLTTSYEIKNNELYYSYCNSADSIIENDEILPRVSNFKVSGNDITKKEEISFEYKACT